MNEKSEIDQNPAKKPGKVKILLLGFVAMLLFGGGGACVGYLVAEKMNPGSLQQENQDKPKLVKKDGSTVNSSHANGTDSGEKSKGDRSAFKATYYPIEAPFTSNLKNSSSFAQISIAVSTYYDEQVLENIKEHETAIRSAVLMTMAEQQSDLLSTQQGKEMLQGLLTTAINRELQEKSGFGGVDNVYFTNFVVQ